MSKALLVRWAEHQCLLSQKWADVNSASHELSPPQQLPIVLHVLLSQAHRVRALIHLKRFLDLGNSAVNLALSVGIFPYVLKLLQSPIDEYNHVLDGIWARVLAFDQSCQVDVVKDRALPHFTRHLRCGLDSVDGQMSKMSTELASEQRTLAAFILSITCSGYQIGQSECINEKLHLDCGSLLQSLESLKVQIATNEWSGKECVKPISTLAVHLSREFMQRQCSCPVRAVQSWDSL